MVEISGGILLALGVVLVVLLFLPSLLRGFAWLLAIGAAVGLAAFFFGTELGRSLIVIPLFAGGVWLVSKALDRRDAAKRAKSEWHIIGK